MKRSMQSLTLRLLGASALALGLAAPLTGAASAKTLVYCAEASPEGFDPAPYSGGPTLDAAGTTVYSRLVEFKKGSTEVRPGLAERWDISPDGLTYTFHLRKGVKFQTTDWFKPTRDLNASDVVFSFKRQSDKTSPWFAYAGGSWEYYEGMDMPTLVKDIVAVDDLTVKFTLTKPNAPMIANLAMQFASIVSKEYADQLEAAKTMANFNQKPVGTGPFQLVDYQKDAIIRYAANPSYYAGKRPIDSLIFAITPDASVRFQKLKAGECHVMAYPNPADIAAMKADSSIKVMQAPGLNVGYLAYNTLVAPFDKPEVRKALNMAIDKKAIISAVFQGAGQAATNPIPPTMWSYNKAVADDAYDPLTAKKMLDAAGVSNLSMKIWAMPVQRPYNPNARRMAEMMQADFAKVGVKVDIVSYDWAEYLKKSKDKNRDGALLLGWSGDNGDPDNFLSVLLGCSGVGGSNRANWCDKSFDDLIQKASTVSDMAERTKLYEQAQVQFKAQAPWATIAHSTVTEGLSPKVQGHVIDALARHVFDEDDLAQ